VFSVTEPLSELARRFGVVMAAVVLGESVMFEAARSSTLAFGKLIGPLSVIVPAKPLTAGVARLPSQPAYIFSAPVPLFVMLPVELMLMNPCERSRSVFEDARLPDGPMMSIP